MGRRDILTVGLKYCGGCNPRYDRVQAVRLMERELAGAVRFVPYDDPGADSILAVMGCKTACADLSPFEGRRVWVVTSEEEVRAWIERMKGACDGGGD